MSVEAAVVVSFLVILLFVLFPPILRLLNTAALSAQASIAIMGKAGAAPAMTIVDDSGQTVPAAAGNILDALNSLNADLAIGTSARTSVGAASALIQYPEDCVVNSTNIQMVPCDTSSPQDCCRMYDGTVQPCDAVTRQKLLDIANEYVRCKKGDPYNVPVLIAKSLDAPDIAQPLSVGAVPHAATPLQNSRPVQMGSGSGGGGGLITWGDPDSALAEILDADHCPVNPANPGLCCARDRMGNLDLGNCSPCTDAQIRSCSTIG